MPPSPLNHFNKSRLSFDRKCSAIPTYISINRNIFENDFYLLIKQRSKVRDINRIRFDICLIESTVCSSHTDTKLGLTSFLSSLVIFYSICSKENSLKYCLFSFHKKTYLSNHFIECTNKFTAFQIY